MLHCKTTGSRKGLIISKPRGSAVLFVYTVGRVQYVHGSKLGSLPQRNGGFGSGCTPKGPQGWIITRSNKAQKKKTNK